MSLHRTVLVIADPSDDVIDYGQQLQHGRSATYEILSKQYNALEFSLPQSQQIDSILLELHSRNSINRLLRQLKEQMGDRCPPIVVVDDDDTESAVQAFRNGAADYLVRDRLTSDDLCRAMENVIANAELRQERQQRQEQTIETLKQLNQELTNRVAELQTLVDILPVGVAITTDPDCAQMHSNAYLRQLLGVAAEANISKSAPASQQPTYRTFRNGKEIAAEALPMQVAGRSGAQVRDVEFDILLPDGSLRQLLCYATPLRSGQNHIRGVVGAFLDITERKQVEAALQASEARYRSLIEATAQIIWNELGDRGEFISPQPAWSAFTGQTYDELKGWGWLDAVHPDDRAATTQAWLIALENRALYEFEHRLRRHDGVYRHMSVRAVPVFEENGAIREWVGVHTDVTERKQAEEALCQSEDRLRLTMESAELGTWDFNPITKVLKWDDQCKAMFGLPPTAEITWDVFLAGLHPDDRERTCQVVLQSFDPRGGGDYDIEYRTVGLEDGIERWVAAKGQAYFDAHGKTLRFIGTVMDITARKQAEEARRESETRFRTLTSHAPVGIFMTDPEGNCLYVNERWCEMAGMSPDVAQGTGWVSALHPDDRERIANVWYQASRDGQVFAAEYRFQTPQGKVTWVQGTATALQRETGEVAGYLGTLTDITERKQAEADREHLFQQEQAAREAAERANRIKDEFLAVLSHELRSPLNPILGWTKLLQLGRLDAAKTVDALATIERNARLQTQLIDDLLDVAKILRGKLSLNMVVVNLSSAVEAALDTVGTTAVAKSISLGSVLPNIGQVFGDMARLQQIVWNLLSNAIKFTPHGGCVDIQLQQVGTEAHIIVKDTGKGISPDFLPHLFESFQQEDASITRRYGGLGLGLAIVRQLVEAHGGTITAHSLGEGLGATFTVQLPLLNVASAVQPLDDYPLQELDLTGIRVLAIDDEPDARELLTALLTEYGAVVLTVASASEVLVNLEAFQPTVLVSDIAMPEVDGYTLIQQVRALPPGQGGQIPAIALTAYAREDDHQRAINSGFQRHITKPLEPARLVQAVVTLAHHRSNAPL